MGICGRWKFQACGANLAVLKPLVNDGGVGAVAIWEQGCRKAHEQRPTKNELWTNKRDGFWLLAAS